MKKLLITALAATAIAATAVPASAQFWAGADNSGVGVQVGPVGVTTTRMPQANVGSFGSAK